MAATTVIKTANPLGITGLDLMNGALFTTCVSGASNGVEFAWNRKDILVLRPAEPGGVTFNFLTPESAGYVDFGVTVTNPSVTIEDTAVFAIRLSELFKHSDNLAKITSVEDGEVMVIQQT